MIDKALYRNRKYLPVQVICP